MAADNACSIIGSIQERPAGIERVFRKCYNDYNLVIALENGNPVEIRIVRVRFTTLCEEHNFEVVVFHSLRHLSTKYKLKMTHGDIKSVQGDTGHAEAEMVTDVYSEIVDEDRRLNAKKLDEEFYENGRTLSYSRRDWWVKTCPLRINNPDYVEGGDMPKTIANSCDKCIYCAKRHAWQ